MDEGFSCCSDNIKEVYFYTLVILKFLFTKTQDPDSVFIVKFFFNFPRTGFTLSVSQNRAISY